MSTKFKTGRYLLTIFVKREGYYIRLRGNLLILALAVSLLVMMTIKPAHAESIYLPIISQNLFIVGGCILPSWGCTQNDNEQVKLYEDGSGTLNSVIACFVPAWGCSPDDRQEIDLYEDGSVTIKTR